MTVREALRDAMAEEMRRDDSVLSARRGGRRVPGRLQGQPGPAAGIRAAPGHRHADHRAGFRRARGRRRLCRPAADRRVHDLQFRHAGDGPDHQLGGEDALYVGRPDGGADRVPRPERHRLARRGAAFAMLCELVRACAGAQGRRPLYRRRSQGPAEIGDPRPEPGHLPRARAGLRRELSGAGGPRVPRADRQGAHRPGRRARHDRRLLAHGEAGYAGRRGAGKGRHFRRGRSICARCGRSMSRRSSPRSRRPTGSSRSRRAGRSPASARRSRRS